MNTFSLPFIEITALHLCVCVCVCVCGFWFLIQSPQTTRRRCQKVGHAISWRQPLSLHPNIKCRGWICLCFLNVHVWLSLYVSCCRLPRLTPYLYFFAPDSRRTIKIKTYHNVTSTYPGCWGLWSPYRSNQSLWLHCLLSMQILIEPDSVLYCCTSLRRLHPPLWRIRHSCTDADRHLERSTNAPEKRDIKSMTVSHWIESIQYLSNLL